MIAVRPGDRLLSRASRQFLALRVPLVARFQHQLPSMCTLHRCPRPDAARRIAESLVAMFRQLRNPAAVPAWPPQAVFGTVGAGERVAVTGLVRVNFCRLPGPARRVSGCLRAATSWLTCGNKP